MAKKKTIKRKVASRKLENKTAPAKANEPEYMVQVSDPKMLRKDLLESLREVIIFMQGYEKFRRIQEEKVALFAALKADVHDLNSLIENKLRKYLPQGKLRGLVKPAFAEEKEAAEEDKVEIVQEEAKKQRAA